MARTRTLKLSVFGRPIQLAAGTQGWTAYYPGADGKRRPAHDIVIPSANLEPSEVVRYVADLCHEWASETHADVFVIGASK